MASTARMGSLFDLPIVLQAVVNSFRKLMPQREVRNPVMFVVYVGSVLTTLLWLQTVVGKGEAPAWFIFWVSVWRTVRVAADPGEAFLDRMIALVEGAKRQKTPNEIALDILLAALTIVFLLATATLLPFSLYSVQAAGHGTPVTVTVLVALLVCLIPTTIGALLSAIGIAGMDRMIQKNVIAMSGRAVEAAGDVDVLLLDKPGTITLGNRQATEFFPADGVNESALADAAQLASLADETPEGRSIVVLAKARYQIREREVENLGATFVA